MKKISSDTKIQDNTCSKNSCFSCRNIILGILVLTVIGVILYIQFGKSQSIFLKNTTTTNETGVMTSVNYTPIEMQENPIETIENMEEKTDMLNNEKNMEPIVTPINNGKMTIKPETGYITYSLERMNSALKSGQKVILFFHANWCPSCRALDSAIQSDLLKIPTDTIILKTDYDSETQLKQKYGVTTQHTIISLTSDGSLAKKKIGSSNLDQVLE